MLSFALRGSFLFASIPWACKKRSPPANYRGLPGRLKLDSGFAACSQPAHLPEGARSVLHSGSWLLASDLFYVRFRLTNITNGNICIAICDWPDVLGHGDCQVKKERIVGLCICVVLLASLQSLLFIAAGL